MFLPEHVFIILKKCFVAFSNPSSPVNIRKDWNPVQDGVKRVKKTQIPNWVNFALQSAGFNCNPDFFPDLGGNNCPMFLPLCASLLQVCLILGTRKFVRGGKPYLLHASVDYCMADVFGW